MTKNINLSIEASIYIIRGQRVMLDFDLAKLLSISIMRTFTRLRSFLAMESQADKKLDRLERETTKVFKIVFEKLDSLEERLVPLLPEKRRRIGLNKVE